MATTKKGKTSTPKQGTAKTTWYGLRSWYYPSGTTLKKAFDEQRDSPKTGKLSSATENRQEIDVGKAKTEDRSKKCLIVWCVVECRMK